MGLRHETVYHRRQKDGWYVRCACGHVVRTSCDPNGESAATLIVFHIAEATNATT